jgi:hypothetical protein
MFSVCIYRLNSVAFLDHANTNLAKFLTFFVFSVTVLCHVTRWLVTTLQGAALLRFCHSISAAFTMQNDQAFCNALRGCGTSALKESSIHQVNNIFRCAVDGLMSCLGLVVFFSYLALLYNIQHCTEMKWQSFNV